MLNHHEQPVPCDERAERSPAQPERDDFGAGGDILVLLLAAALLLLLARL